MIQSNHVRKTAALCAASLLALNASLVNAGTEIEAAPGKKMVTPVDDDPLGMITLGGMVSSELSSVYLDSTLHLWSPGDFYLFLDTRSTLDSETQYLSSYGLGGRYIFPEQEVIVGVNAFYDSIASRNGNDFDQLGLGAEILTRWVDARFNYYLPDDSRYEVGRSSNHSSDRDVTPVFRNRIAPDRILLQQRVSSGDKRSTSRRYEYAIEGWNAEVGFLIPGVEKYMETRLFAGAYGYGDAVGFKARLEARPLPGLIANVEYWEDRKLMGGHWTGELAVSVPFSIFNLAKGRCPFEGIEDSFRPRQREFRERMSDMIIRSHRVMTDTTTTTTTTQNSNNTTLTEGVINLKPKVKTTAAPGGQPQIGGEGGEGGEGEG